ncbi:hypothetical protein [Streptomyces mangrovisoli]|uniref:Lipoprotein n=1 Tax=Streptomyces mangrovisoli TaxID=1428628 RepID=A0A1J4P4A6_9ACTN|nr:hypothetical protein [Streptomyces mangrovisoli]OIJ69583.1 hypothetical protein WN71_001480 [Streptomyces mangrovisoli]
MTRRPVLVPALAFTGLLATAACSATGADHAAADRATPAPHGTGATGAPASAVSALTPAQAQAALLTQADLGAPWTATQGAATWRDGLLKASASASSPDCQRLMDALYTDQLLGAAAAPHATVALDDGTDEAQLRQQVTTGRPADVDRTLDWLRSLPRTCGHFTATTTSYGVQDVQVAEFPLPALGDAREALRVTLTGQPEDADAVPMVLTLDVAAVRVGDDALTLSDGTLGTPAGTLQQAAQVGTQRLTAVRRH